MKAAIRRAALPMFAGRAALFLPDFYVLTFPLESAIIIMYIFAR